MREQYAVIKILNEQEILINYGILDKAKRGDKLRIIEPGPDIIIDGHFYGKLDAIKEYIEVTTAYDQFSICKKIVRKQSYALSPLSMLKTTYSYENMNVDATQIDKDLKVPEITPIAIGDIVEKY
ncbi:Uncharacterised protein [Urinicoccus massiliensis]|uniref:Uncharacterized protein n=1 Tax=Urinicoccus massiliensis TaxID=1723382 RepID=A0A8H2QYT6_9FIRM|nr:hypothetical protein [Urinicoccus massiliensis]VFB17232.1 Uncharacterised protein [Urinicoccus massiliensis]